MGGMSVMVELVENFLINENGDVVARSSAECMDYLQDTLGWSFESARGVLGLAVAKGYIIVISTYPEKMYSM